MRIGIEAQRIFRKKKHGMDIVVIELIKHLQLIDKENEYFIFVNDYDEDDYGDAGIEETENFKFVRFKHYYPIWEQVLLPKYAKEYNLDVLHCTSNTAPIRYTGTLVLTLHDIIFYQMNPLFKKGYTLYQRFGNFYRKFILKRLIKISTKVVTVSEFEKGNLERVLGLTNEKLVVAYNGVGEKFNNNLSADRTKEVRAKYELPEKYMFFLGNTDPKKNTPNTVKAFVNYCKNTENPINLAVGDYDIDYLKDILDEVDGEQYLKNIHVMGYILHDDLPYVLSEAELLLYPSMRESFGIPIIEGMACGTPVITSTITSMPEVAGDAALLVDPRNIKEITKGIHKLLDNESLRAELSAKGLVRAKKFSWTNTAKTMLETYKQAVL